MREKCRTANNDAVTPPYSSSSDDRRQTLRFPGEKCAFSNLTEYTEREHELGVMRLRKKKCDPASVDPKIDYTIRPGKPMDQTEFFDRDRFFIVSPELEILNAIRL